MICRILVKQAKLRKASDTIKGLLQLKVSKKLTATMKKSAIQGKQSTNVSTSASHDATSEYERLKQDQLLFLKSQYVSTRSMINQLDAQMKQLAVQIRKFGGRLPENGES